MIPVRSAPAGTPDIVCFLPATAADALVSVVLALELKSPTGRQRESQKAWQANATAAGVRYHLIRTVEQLEQILDGLGVRG